LVIASVALFEAEWTTEFGAGFMLEIVLKLIALPPGPSKALTASRVATIAPG
jgi:hypothetical protein